MRATFVVCLLLLTCCAMAQSAPAANPNILVYMQWLADHLNDPKVVVLEVDHDMAGMDMGKPKHIPGVRKQLRKLLAARGIITGTKIVTYCEVRYQATHNDFVAKYLGYSVAMYDGSINQWEGKEKLPLIKGSASR